MKKHNIIGASMLAMAVVGLLSGCASAPVGEMTEVYETSGACGVPSVTTTQTLLRSEPTMINPLRTYRPYTLQPVGARFAPAWPSFGNTMFSQTQQPVALDGPTSPSIRSLWW